MASNDSPIAWYGLLNPNERRTLWACFGGWALNSFDFFIFTFALPAIIVALDITRQQAGMITTWTLALSRIHGVRIFVGRGSGLHQGRRCGDAERHRCQYMVPRRRRGGHRRRGARVRLIRFPPLRRPR